MKKTLYSLMLSDDVMREIDALAHRLGTNRSSLVNRILAEHVKVCTPEQQMHDIFTGIEQLLASSRELIPMFAPNTQRVAVRSSLEYKYHPTLRYDVELEGVFLPNEPIGTLRATLRTQSQGLLELLGRFYRCLGRIEERMLPLPVAYQWENARFSRTLAYPLRRSTGSDTEIDIGIAAEEISRAITDYVRLIDRMLKACLDGADTAALADMYAADLEKRRILL